MGKDLPQQTDGHPIQREETILPASHAIHDGRNHWQGLRVSDKLWE